MSRPIEEVAAAAAHQRECCVPCGDTAFLAFLAGIDWAREHEEPRRLLSGPEAQIRIDTGRGWTADAWCQFDTEGLP